MTQRAATFRLDLDILDGLKAVHERDGVPQSEQVRRALRQWLVQHGVIDTPAPKKTARKRVAARKRA